MEQIDVSDGFDMHDYRHGLKLLQETRTTQHLENRDRAFGCPACGNAFGRLFVTEERTSTFDDPGTGFCLARTEEKLLLFTH